MFRRRRGRTGGGEGTADALASTTPADNDADNDAIAQTPRGAEPETAAVEFERLVAAIEPPPVEPLEDGRPSQQWAANATRGLILLAALAASFLIPSLVAGGGVPQIAAAIVPCILAALFAEIVHETTSSLMPDTPASRPLPIMAAAIAGVAFQAAVAELRRPALGRRRGPAGPVRRGGHARPGLAVGRPAHADRHRRLAGLLHRLARAVPRPGARDRAPARPEGRRAPRPRRGSRPDDAARQRRGQGRGQRSQRPGHVRRGHPRPDARGRRVRAQPARAARAHAARLLRAAVRQGPAERALAPVVPVRRRRDPPAAHLRRGQAPARDGGGGAAPAPLRADHAPDLGAHQARGRRARSSSASSGWASTASRSC